MLAVEDLVPLNLLAEGAVAHVAEILGKPEQVHRINELGIKRGSEIHMVRSGSPCIVRMSGQTLCFRGSDVLSVLVRPLSSA